jgi:transitional endoplasmic reticulum ATPase
MGRAGERGTSAEARVLSTFLNEMDGVDGSIQDGVLLLGATNRPSTIDAALLRPGRFDHVIYVPPPDELGRRQILEAQVKVWRAAHLVDSVKDRYSKSDLLIDIDYLASDQVTGLMTGAEIVGGCREASMLAIRESLTILDSETDYSVPIVLQRHIEESLKRIKPLLSDARVLEEYTSFDKRHL